MVKDHNRISGGIVMIDMTEQQLQTLVMQAARSHGVLVYHTHDSRRSEPGFPDLVLVGRSGVLYRELKTEKGKLRPEQEHWLASLVDAGENATTWRPHEWPDRIVSEIRALGRVVIQPPVLTQAALRKRLAGPASGTRKVPPVDILHP